MTPAPDSDDSRRLAKALARAVKALRRHRRMRPPEAARAMGMALRSYQNFEAGRGRLSLERIQQFATAMSCDPFALVCGVMLDRPELALWAADNKLVTILNLSLQDLADRAGEDLARLEPRLLIAAFEGLFTELAAAAARRDGFADAWLAERAARGRSAARADEAPGPQGARAPARLGPAGSGHDD